MMVVVIMAALGAVVVGGGGPRGERRRSFLEKSVAVFNIMAFVQTKTIRRRPPP